MMMLFSTQGKGGKREGKFIFLVEKDFFSRHWVMICDCVFVSIKKENLFFEYFS